MGISETLDLLKLGGDFASLYHSVHGGKKTVAFSLSAGAKIHVASSLGGFLLYVAEDIVAARGIADRLSVFCEGKVAVIPGKGDLLISRKAFAHNIVTERVSALSKMITGNLRAAVITAEALTQYYPKRQRLEQGVFTISKGEEFNIENLVSRLVSAGYKRVDQTEAKGEFALKGDILSVFSPSSELPYRINFFDNEVETIKVFEPDTMVSVSEAEAAEIIPASDILLPEGLRIKHEVDIRLGSKAQDRLREILADAQYMLENDPNSVNLTWAIPFLKDRFSDIGDFLPEDTVVCWDSPAVIMDKLRIYANEHRARVKQLTADGEVTKLHNESIVPFDKVSEKLLSKKTLAFESMTGQNEIFLPEAAFKFRTPQIASYYLNYNLLSTDLRNMLRAGNNVIMCVGDMRRAQAFRDSLGEEEIGVAVTDTIPEGFRGIAVTPWEIHKGFNYSSAGLIVIGVDEMIRKYQPVKTNKKKRQTFTMPQCGDYVVHEIHGIGKCLGIERVKLSHGEKDFVSVEYRDGDKLYVPVEQMDRLQKYSGSDKEPRLSKIGGAEFARLKEKVKNSVREMAFDLLELYGKRQKSRGFKFSADDELMALFEDAFPYNETPDQLEAVKEIKNDMESGLVMDRLLCGDVGYGKTEVAFRAVYKTIIDGKQAAMLAPTTILARQHYNTALVRFNGFGVRTALLSRFQTEKEIKAVLADLAEGKVDFVIATHRLLSSDVSFKDLGLLVLDEEQRFGVEHKEKLKLFKNNVNVLTLSATPIPRTLNMALSGIRDISLLETPPENRLPVQTYVTELTDALLRDVITRELQRDGQVFVLYNRVQTIDGFAAHIAETVPEAAVIVGHGQMSSAELEKNINSFYNKEANVMVSTTIIENGIDLPDANTLVVCDADRLGLSTLYQLRGRVGRNNKLAYAYFTTKDRKAITEEAMKRLTAIMDYTELGSGFNIAMRDLEIRGAGNVLGREQHGHIARVGYDMYVKLLEETVEEISGNAPVKKTVAEVVTDMDAFVPDEYIEKTNSKLSAYKRIAEIASFEERKSELERLTEAYGKVPVPVENLADISLIKNLASVAGAEKVVINDKGAGIIFASADCFKNSSLMLAVGEFEDKAVLSASDKPMVVFKAAGVPDRKKLETVRDFLISAVQ